MFFFLFLCGMGFGWVVGYMYGWHGATGNVEATEPKAIDKIWR